MARKKELSEILRILKNHEQRIRALEGKKQPLKISEAKAPQQQKGAHIPELDFTMSVRAFIKRYARRMSGPKKFTLLLAYLANGDTSKSIKFDVIKKHWKKGLFGGKINSFYSTQAKDRDWIDSQKKEEYNLRPSWKEIFKK